MSKYILDSSALLAVINDERGGAFVEKILAQSVISAVNLSETIGRMVLAGIPANESLSALTDMVAVTIPFDHEIALLAARMIPLTQPYGLSLGDRACLGTAQHLKLEAVTADKAWGKLDIPHLKITLIR